MKKMLSWLLLVVLVLPGCLALAEDREMEGNLYVTGLPIVKEKETFSILVDDSGKAEDKIMYPILEEQTNVHVDLSLMQPYESAKERKNILIQSGEYPDVIGGWLLSEADILNDGIKEGLYIPLEDLIEKYAPNMRKILEIPGVRQTMTAPDGHIYTIPYVIGEPRVTFLPFINTVWLQNVGMEMPTTTEEFRAVLRAFKEKDANGNGDPNDEIPFSADPNNKNLGTFAGWFGVNASEAGSSQFFCIVDGKLSFSANQPGYKAFIKYFASLYAEGLIDPEIFTQDLAMWKSKGKQDLYGVSMAYGSGDFYDMEPGTNATPFAPLPVLSSAYCPSPIWRRNGYGVSTFRTQVAITDRAKNPAAIIRWFDNMFELDNSMQIQNGLYGKRLERLADGSFRRLDDTILPEAERKQYEWGNMFTQSLPKYCPTEIVIAEVEGRPVPYNEKDTADALYEPFLDEPMPKAWISPEDSQQAATLGTDIVNYVNQKMAEWISGEKDVDAEWDAYLVQLNTLGLEELTAIKQKALDSIPK